MNLSTYLEQAVLWLVPTLLKRKKKHECQMNIIG